MLTPVRFPNLSEPELSNRLTTLIQHGKVHLTKGTPVLPEVGEYLFNLDGKAYCYFERTSAELLSENPSHGLPTPNFQVLAGKEETTSGHDLDSFYVLKHVFVTEDDIMSDSNVQVASTLQEQSHISRKSAEPSQAEPTNPASPPCQSLITSQARVNISKDVIPTLRKRPEREKLLLESSDCLIRKYPSRTKVPVTENKEQVTKRLLSPSKILTSQSTEAPLKLQKTMSGKVRTKIPFEATPAEVPSKNTASSPDEPRAESKSINDAASTMPSPMQREGTMTPTWAKLSLLTVAPPKERKPFAKSRPSAAPAKPTMARLRERKPFEKTSRSAVPAKSTMASLTERTQLPKSSRSASLWKPATNPFLLKQDGASESRAVPQCRQRHFMSQNQVRFKPHETVLNRTPRSIPETNIEQTVRQLLPTPKGRHKGPQDVGDTQASGRAKGHETNSCSLTSKRKATDSQVVTPKHILQKAPPSMRITRTGPVEMEFPAADTETPIPLGAVALRTFAERPLKKRCPSQSDKQDDHKFDEASRLQKTTQPTRSLANATTGVVRETITPTRNSDESALGTSVITSQKRTGSSQLDKHSSEKSDDASRLRVTPQAKTPPTAAVTGVVRTTTDPTRNAHDVVQGTPATMSQPKIESPQPDPHSTMKSDECSRLQITTQAKTMPSTSATAAVGKKTGLKPKSDEAPREISYETRQNKSGTPQLGINDAGKSDGASRLQNTTQATPSLATATTDVVRKTTDLTCNSDQAALRTSIKTSQEKTGSSQSDKHHADESSGAPRLHMSTVKNPSLATATPGVFENTLLNTQKSDEASMGTSARKSQTKIGLPQPNKHNVEKSDEASPLQKAIQSTPFPVAATPDVVGKATTPMRKSDKSALETVKTPLKKPCSPQPNEHNVEKSGETSRLQKAIQPTPSITTATPGVVGKTAVPMRKLDEPAEGTSIETSQEKNGSSQPVKYNAEKSDEASRLQKETQPTLSLTTATPGVLGKTTAPTRKSDNPAVGTSMKTPPKKTGSPQPDKHNAEVSDDASRLRIRTQAKMRPPTAVPDVVGETIAPTRNSDKAALGTSVEIPQNKSDSTQAVKKKPLRLKIKNHPTPPPTGEAQGSAVNAEVASRNSGDTPPTVVSSARKRPRMSVTKPPADKEAAALRPNYGLIARQCSEKRAKNKTPTRPHTKGTLTKKTPNKATVTRPSRPVALKKSDIVQKKKISFQSDIEGSATISPADKTVATSLVQPKQSPSSSTRVIDIIDLTGSDESTETPTIDGPATIHSSENIPKKVDDKVQSSTREMNTFAVGSRHDSPRDPKIFKSLEHSGEDGVSEHNNSPGTPTNAPFGRLLKQKDGQGVSNDDTSPGTPTDATFARPLKQKDGNEVSGSNADGGTATNALLHKSVEEIDENEVSEDNGSPDAPKKATLTTLSEHKDGNGVSEDIADLGALIDAPLAKSLRRTDESGASDISSPRIPRKKTFTRSSKGKDRDGVSNMSSPETPTKTKFANFCRGMDVDGDSDDDSSLKTRNKTTFSRLFKRKNRTARSKDNEIPGTQNDATIAKLKRRYGSGVSDANASVWTPTDAALALDAAEDMGWSSLIDQPPCPAYSPQRRACTSIPYRPFSSLDVTDSAKITRLTTHYGATPNRGVMKPPPLFGFTKSLGAPAAPLDAGLVEFRTGSDGPESPKNNPHPLRLYSAKESPASKIPSWGVGRPLCIALVSSQKGKQTQKESLDSLSTSTASRKGLDNPSTFFFEAEGGIERELWPVVPAARLKWFRSRGILTERMSKARQTFCCRYLVERALDQLARCDPTCTVEPTWVLTAENIYIRSARDLLCTEDKQAPERCSCIPSTPTHVGDGVGVMCSDWKCENRATNVECAAGSCGAGDACQNMRLQKQQFPKVRRKYFQEKGFGLVAEEDIAPGSIICEYAGEVLTKDLLKERKELYVGEKDFFFMELNQKLVIDASRKGSVARFINHSCDPNCVAEKWNAKGEPHVVIVADKAIKRYEEITFCYQASSPGSQPSKCYCGSRKCRGVFAPVTIEGGMTSYEGIIASHKVAQANSDLNHAETILEKLNSNNDREVELSDLE